jgi:hypothetical protein
MKLLIIVALAFLFISCSSGWSCQKRYVNNNSYNFKKHHVLSNYDKMMLDKYNIKPLN